MKIHFKCKFPYTQYGIRLIPGLNDLKEVQDKQLKTFLSSSFMAAAFDKSLACLYDEKNVAVEVSKYLENKSDEKSDDVEDHASSDQVKEDSVSTDEIYEMDQENEKPEAEKITDHVSVSVVESSGRKGKPKKVQKSSGKAKVSGKKK